jgi:hypothetical protein
MKFSPLNELKAVNVCNQKGEVTHLSFFTHDHTHFSMPDHTSFIGKSCQKVYDEL